MNHYLGPYVASGPRDFLLPSGCNRSLRLGRVADVPWGLFSLAGTLGAGYRLLGTDPASIQLAGDDLTAWNEAFGLSLPSPTSLIAAILATVVVMPTSRNRIEVHLAGEKVHDVACDILDPAWSRQLDRTRENYRTVWAAVEAGQAPANHHLRVLDAVAEKRFGRGYDLADARLLIPADMDRNVEPLPHATAFSDAFTYSDGELNSVSSAAWVSMAGTTNVASGQAVRQTDSRYRFASNLSSDDHWAEVEWHGGRVGAAVRCETSADTCYRTRALSNGGWTLDIIEAGSGTQLASGDHGTTSAGEVLRLQFDGSSYDVLYQGVSQATGTETTLTGQLQAGFNNQNAGGTLDNWAAEDVAAGGSTFEESATFACDLDVAAVGGLTIETAATFAVDVDVLAAGGLILEQSAAFACDLDLAAVDSITLEESVAFALAADVAAATQLDAAAAALFAADLDLAATATADLLASASFALDAGLAALGALEIGAAASFAVDLDLTAVDALALDAVAAATWIVDPRSSTWIADERPATWAVDPRSSTWEIDR